MKVHNSTWLIELLVDATMMSIRLPKATTSCHMAVTTDFILAGAYTEYVA